MKINLCISMKKVDDVSLEEILKRKAGYQAVRNRGGRFVCGNTPYDESKKETFRLILICTIVTISGDRKSYVRLNQSHFNSFFPQVLPYDENYLIKITNLSLKDKQKFSITNHRMHNNYLLLLYREVEGNLLYRGIPRPIWPDKTS